MSNARTFSAKCVRRHRICKPPWRAVAHDVEVRPPQDAIYCRAMNRRHPRLAILCVMLVLACACFGAAALSFASVRGHLDTLARQRSSGESVRA